MSKLLIFLLFVLLAVVQIVVPASMILRWQETLDQGIVYRFRTEFLDPHYPFGRGSVRLRFKAATVTRDASEEFARGQKVYALLARDDLGFATIESLTPQRPDRDHISVIVRHTSEDKVHVDMPFERYDMEKKPAPGAKGVYPGYTRESTPDSYVTVRIKDGFAVIVELYVDDVPVRDYIKRQSDKPEQQPGDGERGNSPAE